MIALRLPVKVFVINENGDYFWVNREQSANVREFCLVRMGLSGEGAIRTIGQLLIFPFGLLFLLTVCFRCACGQEWCAKRKYETDPDHLMRRTET